MTGKEVMVHKEQKMKKTVRKSPSAIEKLQRDEHDLKREVRAIKAKEEQLIKEVESSIKKQDLEKKKSYHEVVHLSFNDFAQIVIGCCVFTLAALIDTDVWNALPSFNISVMIYVHIFFAFCVLVALNYEFRESFKFNAWFFKMLFKRFFYLYFSVFMIMNIIMILVNRIRYDMTMLEITRNYIAAQSIGMFGAVTYSFLKK